jgi:hypothetical protein
VSFGLPSILPENDAVHRTIQARLLISDNTPADLYSALVPHLGHHPVHPPVASETNIPRPLPLGVTSTATLPNQGLLTSTSGVPTDGWANFPRHPSGSATPSTTIPIPPPTIPYSDHITNAIESYGVPLGIASPINESMGISSSSNPPMAPIAIEQKRWYSEYGIDRDANGLFQCPSPGCSKENKRRDQLWEHWKARHNDDPYRCSFWSVLQCRQSLIKRSHSTLSNKTWIYNGEKAHMCNAEMTSCQYWFVYAWCAWCIY